MSIKTTPRRAVPDASSIAARLRLTATRLARQLRRHAEAGLSPSQLSAIATIEHHGPMTLGALAEHERVARPSITKVVTKLEQLGLVHREVDEDDRRFARVSVTDGGHELLRESRQRKDAWLAARVAGLDADERRRLADALDVIDALTAAEEE